MKPLTERLGPVQIEVPVYVPTPDGKGIAETIMVKVAAQRDPKDGEVYLNGEVLAELDRIKARRMGVLLPTEIKELRRQLGLTQTEMSRELGIGAKTYTRWETGRERPSQSLNRILVALWEGRLNLASLRAMRQPAFPWYERIKGPCPCGAEHRPRAIVATSFAEEVPDEICCAAA
jgi:DNA-binding transcriptional regulator YiaG